MDRDHDTQDERSDELDDGLSEPLRDDAPIGRGNAPEPPARYDAQQYRGIQQHHGVAGGGAAGAGMASDTLKLVRVSQIVAAVSLFIGGVVFSVAALVIAIIAYSKASSASYQAASSYAPDDASMVVKRSAKVAILLSCIALAINVATIVFLYPVLVDMMQSGGYGSLFGSAPSPSAGSGSSTWG